MNPKNDNTLDQAERNSRSSLTGGKIKREGSIKDKEKEKNKPEKVSKTKLMIVYAQGVIIILMFLASLYVHYKISRASP